MTNIKFGTDGWRAIIAKDFTVDNVARVSEAVLVENYSRKQLAKYYVHMVSKYF